MEISKFNEKFNKLEGNIYTVEEEITLTNNLYDAPLAHDNINKKTLNIYTGRLLTGEKITNYFLSTPSETPWKYNIKILANADKVYITYETVGDQVETEDINNVQNELLMTQKETNTYIEFNNTRVSNAEARIKNVEDNKYEKSETFNKGEIMQKFNDLIDSAPGTLDTLNEIATALGNDPNFSATIINLLNNKADKVTGKQFSTEDYSTEEKNKLSNIEDNANNYIHPDKHPAAMIQEDENHMFVSAEEKAAINTSGSDPVFETAGGTGNAITLTLPLLTNGLSKNFIASSNNNGTTTTINEKKVYKPGTTIPPTFKAEKAYTVWYNLSGDCFFIKASATGTALASQVLKNVLFSNENETDLVGTLDLSLLVSANIKSGVTINGVQGKSSVVDTAGANLASGYMLSGASGYANGSLIGGSIPNHSGADSPANSIAGTGAGRIYVRPQYGYYDGSVASYVDDANFIASNIVNNKSIFGLVGSATATSLGGYKLTNGTIPSSGNMITVNTGVVPIFIFASYHEYNWFYFPSCTINGRGVDSASFTARNNNFSISGTTFTLLTGSVPSGEIIRWYAIG